MTGLAVEVAERLRASVQAFAWTTVANELRVTISVGVAGAAEAHDTTALLTLADRRLYAAKHGGRNRVVHSG
ncbi:MAG: diguanylate cyclase [Burkholderiaceae bacterium]